jgi:ketosteroid isomerase-like protein
MNRPSWGLVDGQIVWIQNPNAPDPQAFYEHGGIRDLQATIGEAFDEVRLGVERFIEGEGEHAVALGQMRARGKGSGVHMREARGWVWTLRHRNVVRHQTFPTHDQALEAVGLRE